MPCGHRVHHGAIAPKIAREVTGFLPHLLGVLRGNYRRRAEMAPHAHRLPHRAPKPAASIQGASSRSQRAWLPLTCSAGLRPGVQNPGARGSPRRAAPSAPTRQQVRLGRRGLFGRCRECAVGAPAQPRVQARLPPAAPFNFAPPRLCPDASRLAARRESAEFRRVPARPGAPGARGPSLRGAES